MPLMRDSATPYAIVDIAIYHDDIAVDTLTRATPYATAPLRVISF